MSFDFVIPQGATWRKTVTWFPGGTLANLRGARARLKIRATPDASDTVLDLNSDDGTLVISPDAGTISWNVAPATTAAFVPVAPVKSADGRFSLLGYYDLMVLIGADTYRIQQGVAYLSLSATI